MISDYYVLAKPGILAGNLMTAAAGFFLASSGFFSLGCFFAMLGGIACVIGSSCVLNNVIDRNIDLLMERTKKRSLALLAISQRNALYFAFFLGVLGGVVLWFYTNALAFFFALVGFVVYVAGYSFMKFKSPHATLVGSIAGAMPPLVGYASAKGSFDLVGLALFLVLVFWQMPHFYAIALFRLKEYAAAKIPVLPLALGIQATKRQMGFYGIVFFLTLFGLRFLCEGKCLWLAVVAGGLWVGFCFVGGKGKSEVLWAREVFTYSLLVILIFSGAVAFDFWLPL